MRAAISNRQRSNVAQNKATSSAASTSGESDAYDLVGFGPYKFMSRFDLCHSTQDEHKRYVTSILDCNVVYPGGQLHKLKRYIEKLRREHLEDQLLIKAAEEAELCDASLTVPPPAAPTVPAPAGQLRQSTVLEKVR